MLSIFKDRMEILKHFKKTIIKKYYFFMILYLYQGKFSNIMLTCSITRIGNAKENINTN